MNVVNFVGKLAGLLALVYAFFIAYTFSVPVVQAVSPMGDGMHLVSVIAISGVQSIILATVWGVIFALPLALLWGRFAYLAALICVAPVVITIVNFSLQRSGKAIVLSLIAFSIICLVAIVPTSAHLAYRWLQRRSGNSTRGMGLGA